MHDFRPGVVEKQLPLAGGGGVVFAGNDVAIGKMGGHPIAAEDIVDPRVQAADQPGEFAAQGTRQGMHRVVEVDQGLRPVAEDQEAVPAIGGHNAAGYPVSQREVPIGSDLQDLEAQPADRLCQAGAVLDQDLGGTVQGTQGARVEMILVQMGNVDVIEPPILQRIEHRLRTHPPLGAETGALPPGSDKILKRPVSTSRLAWPRWVIFMGALLAKESKDDPGPAKVARTVPGVNP